MPERSSGSARHRVVVVGGGFGGLRTVRSLRRVPVGVTLIDRRNFHLFQPLLYQVATGGLSPANIAAPLRSILRRQRNATVVLAEVVGFDVAGRRVRLADGEIGYDTLVVAAGARHSYFGHPEWESLAPGLKTIEDATEIRRRVLLAFERAERATDPKARQGTLTFVIVGAGPTGVELAGTLAEISRYTLQHDFRQIDPSEARIVLVEAIDHVLPGYTSQLSERAVRDLERLGVTVRTRTMLTDIRPGGVELRCGEDEETIRADTVLWAAGVQASSLARALADATTAELDGAGRIIVEPELTLPGHPEIFVIGDMANFSHQTGEPLPGIAPVAIQQGRYVARMIRSRLRGRPAGPFRYRDRGKLATIGRSAAVAEIGRFRFAGLFAWLVWLFVHLMALVGFENRLLVFIQWAWSYFTQNRAARLITEPGELPPPTRHRPSEANETTPAPLVSDGPSDGSGFAE